MFMGVQIGRGELATSYKSLSEQTGMSVQNVRTALNHLKLTGEITSGQHSKFSVISIVNYDLYQSQLTSKLTSSQQAANKQLTTIKEYKKERSKEYIYARA